MLSPDLEAAVVAALLLEEDSVVALSLFLSSSLRSAGLDSSLDLEGAEVAFGWPVVAAGDAVVTESVESAPVVGFPVVGGRVAGTVVLGGTAVVVGGGGGGVGLTTRRNS